MTLAKPITKNRITITALYFENLLNSQLYWKIYNKFFMRLSFNANIGYFT